MPLIDAHTHVWPKYAELAVRVMDACGVDCCVTLEWHDGFGDTLCKHLAHFAKWPRRFIVFGNVDWSRVNEPDFGEAAAAQLRADVAAGMQGLKIYKALGLEYRRADGSFWRINDPEFEPIWAEAGRLGIPIVMHTADPSAFWQPVNEANFWNGVLFGEYAWWSYYRKGLPSRDELLGERNDVIARHPKTIFICPHVGSQSENLDQAADDLDRLPNLYYDISARIPEMACSRRRARHAREFLCAYADRVLFGTDIIYDDTNVPTGMQAQCLYQPGAFPLQGEDPYAAYVRTTAVFLQVHLDFLTSRRVFKSPPFCRSRRPYAIYGLGLPSKIREALLWKNTSRLIQGVL